MLSTSADVSTIVSAPRDWTAAPEWFAKLQADAWKEFESATGSGSDRRTLEILFHQESHARFLPDRFRMERVGSQFLRGRSFGNPAGRLIFVNERLVSCEIFDRQLLERGVLFPPLERALEEHPEFLRDHFMAQPVRLGSRKFAALHKALYGPGRSFLSRIMSRLRNRSKFFTLSEATASRFFPTLW